MNPSTRFLQGLAICLALFLCPAFALPAEAAPEGALPEGVGFEDALSKMVRQALPEEMRQPRPYSHKGMELGEVIKLFMPGASAPAAASKSWANLPKHPRITWLPKIKVAGKTATMAYVFIEANGHKYTRLRRRKELVPWEITVIGTPDEIEQVEIQPGRDSWGSLGSDTILDFPKVLRKAGISATAKGEFDRTLFYALRADGKKAFNLNAMYDSGSGGETSWALFNSENTFVKEYASLHYEVLSRYQQLQGPAAERPPAGKTLVAQELRGSLDFGQFLRAVGEAFGQADDWPGFELESENPFIAWQTDGKEGEWGSHYDLRTGLSRLELTDRPGVAESAQNPLPWRIALWGWKNSLYEIWLVPEHTQAAAPLKKAAPPWQDAAKKSGVKLKKLHEWEDGQGQHAAYLCTVGKKNIFWLGRNIVKGSGEQHFFLWFGKPKDFPATPEEWEEWGMSIRDYGQNQLFDVSPHEDTAPQSPAEKAATRH